ncbi:MAG: NfeD family protein [Gammaproteobacteria bacterium]|nr:NfeD family protein [Gammaproteobacteria bacterium]
MNWLEIWEGWAIGALVLLVLEILVPGFYLLWFGVAGLAVALIVALADGLAWQVAMILFAVFSLATILLGDRLWKRRQQDHPDVLNDRLSHILGKTYTADTPITPREGRIRVGDSTWSARLEGEGQIDAGRSVRVVRVEGMVLFVQPAEVTESH